MSEDDWACSMVGMPLIFIRHSDLVRVGDGLRSLCPVCKFGFLPVCRDGESFELLDEDFCLLCGQMFVYVDPPWKGVRL